MKLFEALLKKMPLLQQTRKQQCCTFSKPKHLICFKNWNSSMVSEVLESALNLKCSLRDTHGQRLNILADNKVMILQEVNEPLLNLAVSKAATLLGAYDVNIIDHLAWEHDYMGRLNMYFFVLVVNMPTNRHKHLIKDLKLNCNKQYHFCKRDAIFVATMTHMCLLRFAEQSTVPVVCMRSRTHASIQSLATMMAIIEEFGTLKGLNLSYFGSPHPVLNSYLLLCPMLGVNLKFMCCCEKTPVSPLLYKTSLDMTEESHTQLLSCSKRNQVLQDAQVVIAGPANPKKVVDFKLSVEDIECQTKNQWIFFHTGPRGEEVGDKLFFSNNSKTFVAFENFHYIAAALMVNVLKDHKF